LGEGPLCAKDGQAICRIAVALVLLTTSARMTVAHTRLQSEVERAFPHYTFDIDLNYAYHSLNAVEQVVAPNPSGAPLSELVFNVPAAHEVGVFLLHSISVGDQPADFVFNGTLLTVTLPSQLAPTDAMTVTISFTLFVERLGADVESFAAANLGYTDDMMTVGYWYPMLAPYRAGSGWIAVPWHPVGDPFASESADYTATITSTPGVEIVAGGEMTRSDGIWRFDLPRGRTFAFIASPRYWETSVNVGGVTYSLYTFGEHARLAPVTLQTVVRAASLYSTLYGPYPYTALRVAEVNGPWSMEFAGLVTLGEEEFSDYNGTSRNRLVRITAHEVSHQWWYNVVGDDQAREPWLDEGMARFNELRYYEFYAPRDVGWWRSLVFSQAEPDRMLDATIYDFHYHNSYISSIYNRGAVFLDALRAQIGQPAFDDFLRDLYRRQAFRIVSSDDFFATLATHTRADVRLVALRYFANLPVTAARFAPSPGGSDLLAPAPSNAMPPPARQVKESLVPQ
jgi:hypothetical protein